MVYAHVGKSDCHCAKQYIQFHRHCNSRPVRNSAFCVHESMNLRPHAYHVREHACEYSSDIVSAHTAVVMLVARVELGPTLMT